MLAFFIFTLLLALALAQNSIFEFTVQDSNGEMVSLQKYSDKKVRRVVMNAKC